jgi:hypothetical protein
MDQQRIELWRQIDQYLRAALDQTASDLVGAERRQIEEFLDHNELGLAWEVLIESLAAYDVDVQSAALSHLQHAADLMELDPSTHASWRQLAAGS